MMEKLKPCPFCGGKAKWAHVWREGNKEFWTLFCAKCDARITSFMTKKDAAAFWNRRAERSEERRMKKIEYNEDWKYTPVTEGQMKYIAKMREFSEYPLPKFEGKTKGEAVAYIEKYRKIAYTRAVSAYDEQ